MSGGKSYLLRWGAVAYALHLYLTTGIKGIPIGLFSEDYPTLKDRQISRIQREFPSWLGELRDSKVDGLAFTLADEYGGGKILLRNLDDPSKYMSTEFAGEFVEELTRNPEQTFQDLRNRLRFPGVDEVKFMGATNPGGIGHGWVKKYFINRDSGDLEQDRFVYVHANAYDNAYISKEYIKQLESLPENKRNAYLYGSWDTFQGQYFTEFRRDLHVINPIVPAKNRYVFIAGMDWGRVAPFSFHVACVERIDYREAHFYRVTTFLEVYGTEKTPEEWSKEIKRRIYGIDYHLTDLAWIRGDPAMFKMQDDGGISIANMFKENGIVIREANNDRIGGWELMHKWLSLAPDGKPYWQITSNCINLIRELGDAVHDEVKIEDVDTDGSDHALDDQRYMFKHLKWLEGRVGAAKQRQTSKEEMFVPQWDEGQQISISLDRFK